MMWSWTERGLDQLASLCRDVERMGQMSAREPINATLFDAGTVRVAREVSVDGVEPIMPRTRVKVKRLANGQWQPEITLECFDCDPLFQDQERVIRDRLDNLKRMVDDRIAEWQEDESDGE